MPALALLAVAMIVSVGIVIFFAFAALIAGVGLAGDGLTFLLNGLLSFFAELSRADAVLGGRLDVAVALSVCYYLLLWALCFYLAPELGPLGIRGRAAALAALMGFVVFFGAISYDAPEFLPVEGYPVVAVALALFLLFAVLPAVLTVRLMVWLDPDARAARAGEYFLNPDALEPEVRHIVEKRTGGTFRRPFFRPERWGDRGALTNKDLERLIAEEAEEQTAVADMFDAMRQAVAAASAAERSAALADFIRSLPPDEQALFEAGFRTTRGRGRAS